MTRKGHVVDTAGSYSSKMNYFRLTRTAETFDSISAEINGKYICRYTCYVAKAAYLLMPTFAMFMEQMP